MDPSLDRAKGALLGLAVGDALGAPLEFEERDVHPLVTEMIGGGPFNLKPGEWTDDTAMALCLADSLLANPDLDQADLLRRFVRWWRHGENSVNGECFDIGMTTAEALGRFEASGKIVRDEDPLKAGNGSLMRLAPVAIAFHDDEHRAAELARRQCATTHGSKICLDACAFFAQLLVEAMQSPSCRDALARRMIFDDVDDRLAGIALGSYRLKKRDQIRSTGFVLDTLEAALWAVWHTSTFEEALIEAVNLAGDADTIGAVAGQLAGAIYGLAAIPSKWIEGLAWAEIIEAKALLLAEIAHDRNQSRW